MTTVCAEVRPESQSLCENSLRTDSVQDNSYIILKNYLGGELKNFSKENSRPVIGCLRSRTLKKYVEKLRSVHCQSLVNRSAVVEDLFILQQTVLCLYRYNTEFLNLSYPEYRSKVLYPNVIYILLRLLTNGHKFLQTAIRSVYNEICRKSYSVVYSHINTFYLDHDVIKTDVLYEFLGNGLKKFNPLDVDDITVFYKCVFRNIFQYYFRKEKRINTVYDSVWEIEQSVDSIVSIPVRLGLYRDVLYDLQTLKFYEKSPTMLQLSYNYKVFKNVITSNEFQGVYFGCERDSSIINNDEYKLMKFYDDDIESNGVLEKIKKLPTIYKLLKCVHIINPNSRPYNEMLIKPKVVQTAVLEELAYPFRNMFNEDYIYGILDKIAENFTKTILSGEYVNLFTLSNVKIDQITFTQQLKKFIGICLTESGRRNDE